MTYYLAVDFGTLNDFTAITITQRVERLQEPKAIPDTPAYLRERRAVVSEYVNSYLRRSPQGMPYPEVLKNVQAMLNSPQLSGKTQLIFDATGVGVAVVQDARDMGMDPIAITITGGNKVLPNEGLGGYNVPKRDLVMCLLLAFQNHRIKIAPSEHRDALKNELQAFRMKLKKNGNETYENHRDSDHDDLVLSLAMGVWYPEYIFGSIVAADKYERQDETSYDPLRFDL